MSAQEYDRWYIVPGVERIESDTGDEPLTMFAPKYRDDDGIRGFVGQTVPPSDLDDHYPALTQTHPDVEQWFIVRFYGTWSALNNISVLGDTRNLATNPQDIGAVLSQRLPGVDATDWSAAFFMS